MKYAVHIIIGLWLALLALSAITGCKTKTAITEVIHDTLIVAHSDTLYKVRTDTRTDTMRIETERTIVLTEKGDTMRMVVYRDRWRDKVVTKTDTIYRILADSLKSSVNKDMAKEIIRPSFWSRWGVFLFVVVGCSIVALFIRK